MAARLDSARIESKAGCRERKPHLERRDDTSDQIPTLSKYLKKVGSEQESTFPQRKKPKCKHC